MIDFIEITNFRCFESLKVTGLSRVNLLVGRNAVGKTALLESLFMASGASPELAFRVKGFRGLPRLEISTDPSAYHTLWKDLFFGFDEARHIRIVLGKGGTELRSLEISYTSPQGVLFPPVESGLSAEAVSIIPIAFRWRTSSGQEGVAEPQFVKDGFKVAMAPDVPPLPAVFFASVSPPSPEEIAGWLSQLSIQGTDREVVEAVRGVFSDVEDLSIQVIGHAPAIYATIRHLKEKIPINLVSSGLPKLMAITLAITQKKGGLLYIDEIENGFHHEALISVWALISRLAEKYDMQVFASTHSAECLEAATKGIAEPRSSLALLKLERVNGTSIVKRFSGEALRSAMIDGVEVR
jgi:hypothetical protein